jgi:hypothetical protein
MIRISNISILIIEYESIFLLSMNKKLIECKYKSKFIEYEYPDYWIWILKVLNINPNLLNIIVEIIEYKSKFIENNTEYRYWGYQI